VETVARRAKYALLCLSDGAVLVIHLGMSGRMVIADADADIPPPGRHDHVALGFDDGTVVTYHDPRRFGLITVAEAAGLRDHPLLAGLGPEPLADDFTPERLGAALAGRRSPVKTVLLDQRVVAGLGNIYVSEALFRAGISPLRPAASLAPAELAALVPAIRGVLAEAIAAGGSSLRDYVQASGELGYFQHCFAVYDREGQPCPGCDCAVAVTGGVARLVQSNRSTYWCPRRQR
jgi:formamidopyrimidine-DNA glycosylase